MYIIFQLIFCFVWILILMWCENCCSDHFDYLIIFYSSSSTSLEIYVFVTFWTVKKKFFFLPHLIDTVLVLICIYIYLFLLLFCVFWQNAFCPDVIIMVDWMLNTSYLCICWQKIVFVWFFVVQMTHDLMKTVHDEKLCLLVFCCSNDSWSDEDCAPWKTVCFLLLFLFKWLMTWWRLCPMKNCLLFFCYSDDAWPDEDHAWSRRNSADKIQHRAAVYSRQRCVTLSSVQFKSVYNMCVCVHVF